MINSVVISGRYRGLENDELLLEIDGLEKHQILGIYVSNALQDQIVKYIGKNYLVGIKGYIEINKLHKIIVVATKITFLSSKKAQN